MKLIRWFSYKLMRWAEEYDFSLMEHETIAIPSRPSASIEVDGLSFSVMPATGGTIVQLRKYDRKRDEQNNSTHIIPDGQDIAETIGKIVAIELWKA